MEAASAGWAVTARMPQDQSGLGGGPEHGRHARSARTRKQADEVGSFRCPAAPNSDAENYKRHRRAALRAGVTALALGPPEH